MGKWTATATLTRKEIGGMNTRREFEVTADTAEAAYDIAEQAACRGGYVAYTLKHLEVRLHA